MCGIVFSTDPNFQYHEEDEEIETLLPEKQKLRVFIEKAGRGGKVATIVKGFIGCEKDLDALARTLKVRLGTGGSAKGQEIIIQGSCADKVRMTLKSMGYKDTK